MYSRLALFLLLIATTGTQKIDNDAIKNYSEFFNFGHKKNFDKISRENFENSIIKSKVDILGAVFKQNIAFIKSKNLMDLVFLIDASSTVGQHNFGSELKFVKKLLSDVTVDYNHTRVAVITFSSQGRINKSIDEITNPQTENNKCLLLNKEINSIKYTGGATYTLGAFKAAKEILQNSRPDAEKVLFLITDGYSNGGDPIPVANELKQAQVTIFTIGISNGNIKELYEIATQPGELHSYLLDSFEEFESLARRALHVDLQSGDYYPLGISRPCDGLCEGGNCCDKNAYCTCGTSTGQYSCVCELGYYGSGLQNSCSPCPSGSYAEGPNVCLPCPDVHHITKLPAIGVNSCKCKSGFKNNENSTCEVISCPKVLPLENGYFVKKKECSTVLNSACGVRCNVGYTLSGSSIRLCQEDGTWSGQEPSCQVKTCNKLPTPLHGSIECKHVDIENFSPTNGSHMPVDTTCHFKCERGYTLVGSASRTCLPLAQWDGLRSACKQIKCNKLSKVNFGFIEPKSCVLGKQPYGKECKYSCMDGFELIGSSKKKCTDGTWDNQDDVICKDVTPPDLICPENIIQETLAAKQYGILNIAIPTVIDNSYLNVTTWSKPVSKGSYKFKIGTHQVSFYAQDAFNNKAKCSFNVTILDKEPPTIEACINPPIFISSGPANITWDEPNIYDNSQHVKTERNGTFGIYPIGTTRILYTATDLSNNTNFCLLNITIEEPSCPPIPPPLYGNSECNSTDNNTQCVVTCNEGYALPISPAINIIQDNTTEFYCAAPDKVWTNPANLTTPDCSITEIPLLDTQNGTIEVPMVEDDACKNETKLKALQNSIQESLERNTIETCSTDAECKIITETNCQENEVTNNFVKRAIGNSNSTQVQKRRRKKLNIRFQIRGRNKNRKILNSKKVGFLSTGTFGGYNISVNRPDIVCPIGSFKRKFKCIKCPLGTFHNVTSNSCQSCDIGSYNDKMGQSTCVQCPENYSTRKLHAKSNLDCIEKCLPGTFAHKKQIKHPKNHPNAIIERATLKPYCNSCPLGTFQPLYGQINCIDCPSNTTTTKRGAKNVSECEQLQHPCLRNPCAHGACVALGDYSYTCDCQEHYTGSNCDIFMNPCNSQPCQNDGKCSYSESFGYNGDRVIMFTTYICTCPEGYSGRTCALVANQCDLECKNNATCVLAEDDEPICLCSRGYTGKLCEEKIEKCQRNLCENNGTCVEIDDEFKCICAAGFLGKRCQYVPCDFKPCTGNAICVNGNSTIATQDDYQCVCPEGYQGPNCTEKIDYCAKNPCQNNGLCNSTIGSYFCTCPKGVKGPNCETILPNDYILSFPRSGVTDYVDMKGFDEDLNAISVCFWMFTNDSFNYGTILSYANRDYYNAFTITDYTGIVLYVNNDYIVTDVLLNDGEWHHVCVAWTNENGDYHIYLDSKLVNNGTNLSKSKIIKGKGTFILGQEQDALGGKFSQSESFLGKITQLDVYNHTLTSSEVFIIMNNCNFSTYFGNVYLWAEFAENIKGDITVETSTFCQICKTPANPEYGTVEIENSIAKYACDKGYALDKHHNGRKCLKSTQWEGDEPICIATSCGPPAYILSGYFIGNNFTFTHQIEYKCNQGFNLTGSPKQICNETGRWFPDPPKCLGVQCSKPQVHRRANVTVQKNEDDAETINFTETSSFPSGTQIDIRCPNSQLLDEETTLTCMPDGEWDFEPPACKGKYSLSCNLNHIPVAPDNGYRDEESYREVLEGTSDTVEYICRKGYKQINSNFSTCIIDGYWSELEMKCQAITCKEPRRFMAEYGLELVEGQANKYELGHMVRYECSGRHLSVGNLIARCIYPGTWSTINGYCQKTQRVP